ncbi:hypothetical protein PENSPDRAFT_648746 [Peniophora sp. CONT]|nr:hypothetical protein PENSPDRAFT_648746 [Peniophora sp. CONT]
MPEGVTDPNWKPEPGRVGNLTIPQQHALETLKKELEAEGKFVPERMDDPTLLRFLRARKFDVPKAKEMLLSCEEWRKEFGVEDIIKNFDFTEKAEVDKYYPQYYHKTDKDGRPIYIEVLGKLDIKALYAATTPERQLQRLVHEYERSIRDRLPAASKMVGHPVETFCTILDLKNVSLSNFWRVKDYVGKATQIGQDRYPEVMGKFYIINAPWGFSTVWSAIKGWLDPVTVAKIDVCGSDFKTVLSAQIPAENLPKEYGGTCACEGSCSLSDAGPWNVGHQHETEKAAAPAPAVAA